MLMMMMMVMIADGDDGNDGNVLVLISVAEGGVSILFTSKSCQLRDVPFSSTVQ